ncbi:MAG: hypothetical protein AB7T09_08910 [Planctomycetota bacterium]
MGPAPASAPGLPAPAPGYVVTDAGDVTVEHLPGSAGTAARVARLYRAAAAAVEARLGIELPARPHAIVAWSDDEFARRHQRETGERPASGNVLAIALPGRDRVLLRESGIVEGTNAGLEGTLRHELAHLALGRLEGRRGVSLPRWLNEGLAELAAGRTPTGAEASALASWAKFAQMPAFAELARSFPAHGDESARAYTVSMAFLVWLDQRAPAQRLVAALGRSPEVDAAFRAVYGEDAGELDLAWRAELADRQSSARSFLFSLDVWSVCALLAILAGLRAYWGRHQLSRQLAAEEAMHDARLREAWANTFARLAEDPSAPVYCPECRRAFLERDIQGIGCPACGARPLDEQPLPGTPLDVPGALD